MTKILAAAFTAFLVVTAATLAAFSHPAAIAVLAACAAWAVLACAPRPRAIVVSLLLSTLIPVYYLLTARGHVSAAVLAPPGLLILAVVAARTPSACPAWFKSRWIYLGGAFALYSLIIATVLPQASRSFALASTAIWISALIVLPILLARSSARARTDTCIVAVGAVVAMLAVLEYLTHINPLGTLFAQAGLDQKWETYRPFTTVGHPLLNGMIMAVGFAVAVAKSIRDGAMPWAPVAALLLVGTISTSSRSAAIAAVAGAALAVILGLRRTAEHSHQKGRATLMAVAATVVLFVAVPGSALVERIGSSEGQGSAELRASYVSLLPDLLRTTDYFGTGANSSDLALKRVGGPLSAYPIESGVIQIIVSFGVVGGLLLGVYLLCLLSSCVKRGALVGPAGAATFLICGAGWNVLEALPQTLVILSLLLAYSVSEALGESSGPKRHSDVSHLLRRR